MHITTPAIPWKETREELMTRLKQQAQKVNDEHDVEGLCNQFPSRLRDLRDRQGGALKK